MYVLNRGQLECRGGRNRGTELEARRGRNVCGLKEGD